MDKKVAISAGWSPPAAEVREYHPRKSFGQNPAFWLVLGRKICSSTLDRNISNTLPEHYRGRGVRDIV